MDKDVTWLVEHLQQRLPETRLTAHLAPLHPPSLLLVVERLDPLTDNPMVLHFAVALQMAAERRERSVERISQLIEHRFRTLQAKQPLVEAFDDDAEM